MQNTVFGKMKQGLPCSPQDLPVYSPPQIPTFVFDVINDLLAETDPNNMGERILSQIDIERELKRDVCARDELSDWLRFEPHYREVGWSVTYESLYNVDIGRYIFKPAK